MSAAPIRCTADHPSRPGTCNAWLTNAVPGSVQVKRGSAPPPGCIELKCSRCGARYVVCPRGKHG